MLVIAATLILAWLYISLAQSCCCRILTAVSRDELPSVYRTWTARRFLARVEPRIAEAQGRLEGNGFEIDQAIATGPASVPGEPVPSPPATGIRHPASVASMLFVATLFVSAVAMLLTLHSSVTLVTWLSVGFLFVEMAAVVGIFMQNLRRTLPFGMRPLAIAAVIKMGIAYYTGVMMMSFVSSRTPGISLAALIGLPPYMLLRQADAWADLGLGLLGLVLLSRWKDWE